jgi:two-component system, LytTR family, response regulator
MSDAAPPTTVLVVDDEPHERAGLKRIVDGLDDFRFAGEAADGASAVRAIRELAPELVLLDVQMPPPDGLEVIRQVGPEAMPAVVFVTAWDRYAVAAFEAHAVDYVLKPFREARLVAAMRRARGTLEARRLGTLARRFLAVLDDVALSPAKGEAPARVVVHGVGRTELVPVGEIVHIEASGYCVTLHTRQRTFVHRESMRSLAARLPADRFVRVHRSAIVNMRHVRRVSVLPRAGHELTLADGSRVRVSRSRWGDVERMLRRWREGGS